MNPALLRNIAPDGYALHVPKGTGDKLTAFLERVPGTQRAAWRMHLVESGDTLASIAHRYGSSAARIAQANNLVGDEPVAGDRLVIPASLASDTASAARHTTKTAAKKNSRRRHA